MRQTSLSLRECKLPLIVLDTAVIGSGCAGYNAADWLWDFGRRDIALLTEGVNMGTSRNTGSDKQTYYKLSLASDGMDSVASMAADLYAGEGVNGDTAWAEAANSVRSFIKLANLGVPFPTNEYGEYVGYKTDHDPRQRATSAGPLTSKYMTEALERSVRRKGIPVLDGVTVVQLLTEDGAVRGALCLEDTRLDSPSHGLFLLRADHILLATGGPAGVYWNSVYPESQTGMSGMALEAGAAGANLQEWQYGLASIQFRWNVSGTYQQVLPRYCSIDRNGQEREFLPEFFRSPTEALNQVFLKGYQWPFDSEKASSLIDLLVHHEIFDLGRRVYLDYRTDPAGLEQGFQALSQEAYHYLEKSRALTGTPIARLQQMNPQAIALYRGHGIDLMREPLEISPCAQHHNGGIAVDANWQTSLTGLYAAGECAGTFGAHRPGGSALNSTQVGSLRAAEHIAFHTEPGSALEPGFLALAEEQAGLLLSRLASALSRKGSSNAFSQREETQRLMSRHAAYLRDMEGMEAFSALLREKLEHFWETMGAASPRELPFLLKTRDIFITQQAVLSAMIASARQSGSRGSALLRCPKGARDEGSPACEGLPDYRFFPSRPPEGNRLIRTEFHSGRFDSGFEAVRELPHPDNWFETVWADYQKRRPGGQ